MNISAVSFWTRGQREFFDISVFALNARRKRNQWSWQNASYETNEKEKKRQYNERVLQVENGTFTPLVFSTNGAMGRECIKFYQRLSELIAEKRKVNVRHSNQNFVFSSTIDDSLCTGF